jgi:transposase
MASYRDLIRASFEEQPARTVAEACDRIFQLTGLRRSPSQVRKFLKDMGLKYQRVRMIPVPPKKTLAEQVETQATFLDRELQPCLGAAQAATGHVFFVDAAHFVFGTFLCCLWSFARIFMRAASGRQRFNVLGAWNAITRQLITVTNTTVVNTETMCELLRKIAASGLSGPITLVLDNARYQHNAAVKALAKQLGITLLFLPSYSPNLNLIERLWKFTKRRALYGRYHPTFAAFQAAIQEILDGIPTTYAKPLETLMTLNFQMFEDVSLMAA